MASPNNKAPLLRKALIVALALTVLIQAVILAGGTLLSGGTFNLASVLPGVVATLTNDARGEAHLASLTENELLQKGAQMKAEDMAARGYFSHTDPDGQPPWKWFREAGYRYEYAGENLAVNFSESEDVVDAWLKSPTHRANIMKAEFSEIGIGVAEGMYKGQKTTFVVQFFGKPGSSLAGSEKSGAGVSPEELLVSGEVLGTSTSMIERFVSSPMTDAKMTLYGLIGLLALALLVGFLFGKRFPALWPTIMILLVLAVALGYTITHEDELFGVEMSSSSS